ncbi:MAG TPA: hypothetical protein VKY15_00530 [Acidimicrobiales bacterium]|nr:hypothetical protein [Acidimicrobiales bacterium]
MNEEYAAVIKQVTPLLKDALLTVEGEMLHRPVELDQALREVLRQLGLSVMQAVLEIMSVEMTEQALASDPELTVQHRHAIDVFTVFGAVSVPSPYLWRTGQGVRPAQQQLGLHHGQRSTAVERALTDFGAEESFGQAAARFAEHYGWTLGRTSVLRIVERRAHQAQAYVEQRLEQQAQAFDVPLGIRPGVENLLVELDGCEIRTGILAPAASQDRTPIRGQPKRMRVEQWREVRVGLTRQLDEVEPSYVARMGTYPEVVEQLFQAAVGKGLSSQTLTVAVGDGGNGLREELEVQFPHLQFIYDRPHLKEHLYETAEAMGLMGGDREVWVQRILNSLDQGDCHSVLHELASYRGCGLDRVAQLHKHLGRLADAVHYAEYRARGWPLGSGEVESAHRYIPQKRLKLPGACWSPTTINPMLALRIIRANDWWQDFWAQQPAAAA